MQMITNEISVNLTTEQVRDAKTLMGLNVAVLNDATAPLMYLLSNRSVYIIHCGLYRFSWHCWQVTVVSGQPAAFWALCCIMFYTRSILVRAMGIGFYLPWNTSTNTSRHEPLETFWQMNLVQKRLKCPCTFSRNHWYTV